MRADNPQIESTQKEMQSYYPSHHAPQPPPPTQAASNKPPDFVNQYISMLSVGSGFKNLYLFQHSFRIDYSRRYFSFEVGAFALADDAQRFRSYVLQAQHTIGHPIRVGILSHDVDQMDDGYHVTFTASYEHTATAAAVQQGQHQHRQVVSPVPYAGAAAAAAMFQPIHPHPAGMYSQQRSAAEAFAGTWHFVKYIVRLAVFVGIAVVASVVMIGAVVRSNGSSDGGGAKGAKQHHKQHDQRIRQHAPVNNNSNKRQQQQQQHHQHQKAPPKAPPAPQQKPRQGKKPNDSGRKKK
jgi:hypothetical protein